ncbi:MAG: response regulator transcription factor [Chloroflexi bacterium]|nr:response regulator transcription factor [Chloroflexota bacterium]
MRILIVDDHILFREGLVGLLNGQPDTHVIGQAGSVQEATALAHELQPDLVLMDFGLPDGTGLDATKAILAIRPETKIVFLTMHEDDERLFEAIRTGAKGYLLKNVHATTLLTFLRGVDRGEAALTPTMTSKLLNEFARLTEPPKQGSSEFEALSTRELQVLKQLKKGATNREIAEQLFISENTVKNHVRNILTKLGLQNRRQAANYFGSKG